MSGIRNRLISGFALAICRATQPWRNDFEMDSRYAIRVRFQVEVTVKGETDGTANSADHRAN